MVKCSLAPPVAKVLKGSQIRSGTPIPVRSLQNEERKHCSVILELCILISNMTLASTINICFDTENSSSSSRATPTYFKKGQRSRSTCGLVGLMEGKAGLAITANGMNICPKRSVTVYQPFRGFLKPTSMVNHISIKLSSRSLTLKKTDFFEINPGLPPCNKPKDQQSN